VTSRPLHRATRTPYPPADLAKHACTEPGIPDVTRHHFAVNIRKHVVRARRLEHLVRLGSLSAHAAAFLDAAVRAGLNILVAGATQAENKPARKRQPSRRQGRVGAASGRRAFSTRQEPLLWEPRGTVSAHEAW
jgi:hypothetical protein